MADIDSSLKNWSTTASSNAPAGATSIGGGLDDNLRQIQATVRADLASIGSNIASASTTDLGAVAGTGRGAFPIVPGRVAQSGRIRGAGRRTAFGVGVPRKLSRRGWSDAIPPSDG